MPTKRFTHYAKVFNPLCTNTVYPEPGNHGNCDACVTPIESRLDLVISLASTPTAVLDGPIGYTVTVTLTITNNTDGELVVTPGTFDPTGITWGSDATIAGGASGTITGTIFTTTAGDYTVSGYVESGAITSNEDSETIDTTAGGIGLP